MIKSESVGNDGRLNTEEPTGETASTPDSAPADQDQRVTRMIIKQGENIPPLDDPIYSLFTSRPIHMHRGNMKRTLNYYDIHNLANTKKIEIVLDDGKTTETVNLPSGFSEKIADFLRTEHINETDFDCYEFVNYIYGFSPDNVLGPDRWSMLPLNEVKPGDAVLVAVKKDDGYHSEHVAIAIGKDLYLSQLGMQSEAGRLSVMTLKEMMEGYHADYACKIVPKQSQNEPELQKEIGN